MILQHPRAQVALCQKLQGRCVAMGFRQGDDLDGGVIGEVRGNGARRAQPELFQFFKILRSCLAGVAMLVSRAENAEAMVPAVIEASEYAAEDDGDYYMYEKAAGGDAWIPDRHGGYGIYSEDVSRQASSSFASG